MDLRPLTLSDREIFDKYLWRQSRQLASYSFDNTYIWRVIFDLEWTLINDAFCLFFKNRQSCFMNFLPLGRFDRETVRACFEIMERYNHNADISRIENIEKEDLSFFEKNGFKTRVKNQEYIVRSCDIALLKGERFKHKRSLYNYFVKHYHAYLRNYEAKDKAAVEALADAWGAARCQKNTEVIYRAMIDDSRRVLSGLLHEYKKLNFNMQVVVCVDKIIGFTSGFALSPELFCVNFEIADLSYKGLAQFVFTEFAKTLEYPSINMMDDSEIENLKKTKLSYRPQKMVSSYVALLDSGA